MAGRYSKNSIGNKWICKFEKKYKRIIFDHLSPQSPNLKGLYSFYVPDFSYDSYQWKRNSWNLYTDVIVVNKKDKKRKVQVLGQNKRGKIKKKKIVKLVAISFEIK